MNETAFSIAVNNDREIPTVSGRELHSALMIDTRYNDWFKRMCDYGFTEGTDYYSFLSNRSDGLAGKQRTDHQLTIDMAKELCMIQRTDVGKRCRQYFLDLERKWNSPEAIMARALQLAQKKLDTVLRQNQELITANAAQSQIIGELRPKADYTDIVLKSQSALNISQIAKDYGMAGKELNSILARLKIQYKQGGQWLLYSKYQSCGYTKSETIPFLRSDGYQDSALHTKWTQKGRLFIYNKLKEIGILPLIERESEDDPVEPMMSYYDRIQSESFDPR